MEHIQIIKRSINHDNLITKPNITHSALLLNINIYIKHISTMVNKASRNSLFLRPHFKIHQPSEISKKERNFDFLL
jgi:hypothetical protein